MSEDGAGFARLAALGAEGIVFVLCTVVRSGGSAPQKPGARMAVLRDGTLGTIGGGAVEHRVIAEARELLAGEGTRLLSLHLTRDLGMCCGGTMEIFLERVAPPPALFVFGAGHVARPLAALALQVGFAVHVVDEREEWLTAERFPGARLHLEDPAAFARKLPEDPGAFFVVTTHDHALDVATLLPLTGRKRRYLGMIGSQRKALTARARLEHRGVPAESYEDLRSPMGLSIGARTPEEIAVSVVAELIAVRRAAEPPAEQAARAEPEASGEELLAEAGVLPASPGARSRPGAGAEAAEEADSLPPPPRILPGGAGR